jgi:DNA-binding MarR family transcriptional regulator
MADIQWLKPAEKRAWHAYIDLSVLLGDYLDRHMQHDAGMSHTTYHLLTRLAAEPGQSMRMTDLAESLRITRSRLSHTLSKLEQIGLVRREDDPVDKRGQFATLTIEGQSMLDVIAPSHVSAVRKAVFDQLSPEQVVQFAEISEIIVRGLISEDGKTAVYPSELPWRRR